MWSHSGSTINNGHGATGLRRRSGIGEATVTHSGTTDAATTITDRCHIAVAHTHSKNHGECGSTATTQDSSCGEPPYRIMATVSA